MEEEGSKVCNGGKPGCIPGQLVGCIPHGFGHSHTHTNQSADTDSDDSCPLHNPVISLITMIIINNIVPSYDYVNKIIKKNIFTVQLLVSNLNDIIS